MAEAVLGFDKKQVEDTAKKFSDAAANLPKNFQEVVNSFKKLAEKSGSNALMNRYEEVDQLMKIKLIPACEIMKQISTKLLEELEQLQKEDN